MKIEDRESIWGKITDITDKGDIVAYTENFTGSNGQPRQCARYCEKHAFELIYGSLYPDPIVKLQECKSYLSHLKEMK